jgi:broad specificity phosphatase PhoE
MATARLIANKNACPIRLDKSLRERNFGVLSGHLKGSPTLPASYWQAYENRYLRPMEGVPGVESEQVFEQRIRAFIGKLIRRHPQQRILLVTHGEWLRALSNILNGKPSWQQGAGVAINGQPLLIDSLRLLTWHENGGS